MVLTTILPSTWQKNCPWLRGMKKKRPESFNLESEASSSEFSARCLSHQSQTRGAFPIADLQLKPQREFFPPTPLSFNITSLMVGGPPSGRCYYSYSRRYRICQGGLSFILHRLPNHDKQSFRSAFP